MQNRYENDHDFSVSAQSRLGPKKFEECTSKLAPSVDKMPSHDDEISIKSQQGIVYD